MPYIFQRRIARDNQMPDADDFNQDILPAAEKISGRLNAHDFNAGDLKTNVTVDSNAYYKPYYKEQAADPGWGSGGSAYTYPTFGSTPATGVDYLYPNSNWTALTNISHNDVSIGNGNLWIVGWAQYVLQGFDPGATNKHAAGREDSGIQFAIRVDGEIIQSTVTAHNTEWHRPCQPLIPNKQRDDTSVAKKRSPGPGFYKVPAIKGIGPHVMPVRVTCSVPVLAGTHSVELVARVVGQSTREISSLADVQLAVYNRKLFVLGCPQVPSSAPSRAATSVPAFEPGDDMSTANLYTSRVEVLKDAYNDISDGDVARGALQHHHLPNTYLDQAYVEIDSTPSSPTIDCLYPGFGDATMSGAKNSGNNGWWIPDDGSGNALRTDQDLASGFDVSSQNSWVIVIGNLHVRNIYDTTPNADFDRFAALSILYRTGGSTWNNVSSAEAYVNRFTRFGQTAGTLKELPLEIDMPVFHVFDYSSSTGTDMDLIAIGAAGFDLGSGGTPASPKVDHVRGALTVIQLRA